MDPVLVITGGVVGALIVVAILWHTKGSKGTTSGRWTAGRKVQRAPVAEAKSARKKKRGKRRKSTSGTGESLGARVVKPFSSLIHLGDTSQSKVQEMLVHAGIRERGAVEIFLGAKVALAILLPLVSVSITYWLMYNRGQVDARRLFMIGAIALIIGLIGPNIWLRKKAQARIQRIRLSLPDALDLMIVCVEAGLGLDAALVRISNEMIESAPEICEEFTLLNLELSAGKPREECLRNLGLRTGCDEVESLAARINQASKYGTNLGHSLRIHSESLRQKRRQEAEERAAKTAVKLLFPLVFFIFPAIFVVILGPGVVKVLETFGR